VSEDLIDWLRAQLADDQRKAEAATPGPWWDSKVLAAPGHHTIRGGPDEWRGFDGSLGGDTLPIARVEPAPDDEGGFVTNHDADAEHIARHDPARVLREVDSFRKIIAEYGPARPKGLETQSEARHGGILDAYRAALLILAAIFDDRPGYREEWRP
jgi:hypothetical protein